VYEKAVVCTDLSEESAALVACAAGLRALGLNEVVLTHVVDVFSGDRASVSARAEAAFERQVEMLEARGLRVKVEAPLGHPAFSVREVAALHGASLVVAGTHGASMLAAPFSGSVSSDLVAVSRTPLFVAALMPGESSVPDVLEHVLVATDFSDAAESAFETAVGLVEVGARQFTLLHVQDVARIMEREWRTVEEFDRTDTIRLEQMRERLMAAGADRVETHLVHGSPAEELRCRGAAGVYSLIVMGSRGRSERTDAVLGRVSDRAMRATHTPILFVPRTAEEAVDDRGTA